MRTTTPSCFPRAIMALDRLGRIGIETETCIHPWLAGEKSPPHTVPSATTDRIKGGAGNALLVGGFGADLFICRGPVGNDTITDFIDTGGAEDDRIRIAGCGVALASCADRNISFTGGNATIDLSADVPGAGVITRCGISGGLDAADFVFA